jgi:hypothetical protein
MKNSNDTIGNRYRDLPVCIAVPQPTAPPRAPDYTGRFIMYSGIKKNYDRKTVGHVFTKPVQIEGTTQKFYPESCLSS